ncbi:TPA: hypothetical protein P0E12_004961 [Vibrio harveyi]|nr:hypothetical protein [Vibrio harveyi]
MAVNFNDFKVYSMMLNGSKPTQVKIDGKLVLAPPTISKQPVGGSLFINTTQSVSVTASSLGGDISYQWYKNGSEMKGETDPVLIFMSDSSEQLRFKCKITNAMGSVWSSEAVWTIKSYTSKHKFTGQRYYWSGADQAGYFLWNETDQYGSIEPNNNVFNVGAEIYSFYGTAESWAHFPPRCDFIGASGGRLKYALCKGSIILKDHVSDEGHWLSYGNLTPDDKPDNWFPDIEWPESFPDLITWIWDDNTHHGDLVWSVGARDLMSVINANLNKPIDLTMIAYDEEWTPKTLEKTAKQVISENLDTFLWHLNAAKERGFNK